MKKALFIFASLLVACSNQDTNTAKVADDQSQTGCDQVKQTNMVTTGANVTVTAIFKGCHEATVFLIETHDAAGKIKSQYRAPANCDITEQMVQFAKAGDTLYTGLVGCGPNPVAHSAYTITISGKEIKANVGTLVEYIVK